MTGSQSFKVVTTAAAPPERVFDLLRDAEGWAGWMGWLVPASSWELPDGVQPGAVGSIRVLGRPPLVTREQIVEDDPPRRHAYRMVSGLPLRDYLGTVDLTPYAGGTRIEWQASFNPAIPGTGRLMRAGCKYVVTNLSKHLVAAAAQPSGV